VEAARARFDVPVTHVIGATTIVPPAEPLLESDFEA
jgi:hypothetical protein